MLPLTRANLDNLCSTCLTDIRPSVNTQKVYHVNEEINLSKWLKLTAHITVLRNPMNQKYIEEYCKKLCEICFLKAQYSYDFRDCILAATIAVKDMLENERLSEDYIEKLQQCCRICLNRTKCTPDQTLTMEYLKWLKNGSGLSFTTLRQQELFRLKEGTNITELMTINDAQFPKQICKKCLTKLRNMEEFRILATQSFEYMITVMGDADKPPPPIALPIQLRNVEKKATKTELLSLTEVGKSLNDAKEDEMIFEDVKDMPDDIKIEQVELIETAIERQELMYPGEIKILENSDQEFEQMFDEREDFCNVDDNFNGNSTEDESSMENIPIAKLKNIECVTTRTLTPNHIESDSLDNDPIGKTEKLKSTTIHKKLFSKSKKVNIKDENQIISGHSESEDQDVITKKQSKAKKHKRKAKSRKEIDSNKQSIKNDREIDDSKDSIQLNIDNNETDSKPLKLKLTKKSKQPKNNDNMEFKCDLCPRVYRHRQSLASHKKKHLEEKPVDCEVCSKTFLTIYNLKRHQREIHCAHVDDEDDLEDPNSTTCTVCLQKFRRKQHLIDHMRAVHEQLKPYPCSYCDKSFATPGNKRVHELCHTDTFPFVCDWCAKRFRQSNQLKVHLEIHTTPSELLCPICKRAQTSTDSLQQHLKQHDDKRLQCPSCGKLFTKASHMRDHQNAVHLKLRPFKCEFCDSAFGDRKTRKMHEKSHTEDRPEVCTVCKRGFKNRKSLGRHVNVTGHSWEEFKSNNKKSTKKPKLKPPESIITAHQPVVGFHWMV